MPDRIKERSRGALGAKLTVAATLTLSAGIAFGADSDLDPTFDGPGGTGNGKFSLAITPGITSDNAVAVAIQADGKLVVAGYTDSLVGAGSDDDFVVARFNPNGSLDTGFGGDGIVITKVAGTQDDFAADVAIQPSDGKIVVAGTAETDATAVDNFDFAIVRYNVDGSLDTNTDADPGTHLDTDGIFTTGVGSATNADDEANGVAIQPLNGKIVVGGQAEQSDGLSDFALVRLNAANGSLDTDLDGDATMPGFPGNGKVTTDFVDDASGFSIAIQSDNRIVIAGRADTSGTTGTGFDFALARYNEASGALDPGFDSDGKVTTAMSAGTGFDVAYHLTIQPSDGKLVAVGSNGLSDFALARYNAADGTLDSGFDGAPTMPGFPGNGKVTTPFNNAYAGGVAIQANGKIVAVGSEDVNPSLTDFDFALARYNGADGALDASFAGDGILTDSLAAPPGDERFDDVAIDGSGRIVAVGTTIIAATGNDWALARYGHAVSGPVQRCAGEKATIAGTKGNDTVKGTSAADVIAGLGGKDVIRGLGGNDLVCGGAGRDTLIGGAGRDSLLGQGGPDLLKGGRGRDTLKGGPGRDRLLGGAGKDKLKGGPGRDVQHQ